MRHVLLSFDYRAHERFVAPARETAELWRLPLGLVMTVVIVWFCAPLVWHLLYYSLSDETYRQLYYDDESLLLPESNLVLLFSFALIWLAVAFVVMLVHRRRPETLIGPPTIAWMHGKFVVVALLLLSGAVFVLPPYGFDQPLQPGLEFSRWVVFLIPALIAVFIQTSAEEVLFRGYIQQQLAARFSHPALWMVLPSALFGLAHYSTDTYAANAWLVVLWAFAFGLITSDLTARSGTLGPAIALHFVSNVSAFLIVSPQGEMSGLALYQYSFATTDVGAVRSFLPVDFALMVLGWLAARLALRR